jgi:hypothetical protein
MYIDATKLALSMVGNHGTTSKQSVGARQPKGCWVSHMGTSKNEALGEVPDVNGG